MTGNVDVCILKECIQNETGISKKEIAKWRVEPKFCNLLWVFDMNFYRFVPKQNRKQQRFSHLKV